MLIFHSFLFYRPLFYYEINLDDNYPDTGGKLRFIPVSATITNSINLSVDIEVPKKSVTHVEIPLNTLAQFSSLDNSQLKYLNPSVDISSTNGVELGIKIKLDTETRTLVVPLITFIAAQDIDFKFKPEIVYIGQSFNMVKRWRSHKQVNRVASILTDNEELRLYYIHFKFFASFNDFGDQRYNSLLDMSDRTSELFHDRVSVLEQALIQFYCPSLNSQLVGGKVETAPYKRIIETTNIKGISMSLGMHGHAFQFWSPQQQLPVEVVTLIDESGMPSFRKGLMLDELYFN